MLKDVTAFLKTTNVESLVSNEKTLQSVATYVEQFSKMVCEAKFKYLKTSIVEIMRNDIMIKNMTDEKEGKSYFIGKELAHKHILQTMEEIRYANLSDLKSGTLLNSEIKDEINLS